MTTKTFDGQTARFLATVATCMPVLSSDVMQGWIDNPKGLKKFLGGLNPQDAVGDMLVRRVRVDRLRTPQEMLDATGRTQYTDHKVVAALPRSEGEEVDVYFFKLDRYISVAGLMKEYESHGLKPDPYAQAAVNEADPTFADEHPNGCQWRDADSNTCYLTFRRWGGKRVVSCGRSGHDWDGDWFFAGVRK